MNDERRVPDDSELAALARKVGEALIRAGLTVATAESCTGGWIAKALTDISGSSGWVLGGIVTYSNEAKTRLLGVPSASIEAEGAVSRAVVEAMAEGAAERTGARVCVAVSGIAGPDGGSADKPVGTVWFAWTHGGGVAAERANFPGDREAVRRRTVRHALEGILRMLDQ